MAQSFTICRVGTEWAVRDVTGELYGKSPDINHAIATARRLASRSGGRVEYSREAHGRLNMRPPSKI